MILPIHIFWNIILFEWVFEPFDAKPRWQMSACRVFAMFIYSIGARRGRTETYERAATILLKNYYIIIDLIYNTYIFR